MKTALFSKLFRGATLDEASAATRQPGVAS